MSETYADGDFATGNKPSDMPVIDDFESLVDTVIAHKYVFVRYSRGPQTDGSRSMEYEAEVELPGLSVTNLTPESWWRRPIAD